MMYRKFFPVYGNNEVDCEKSKKCRKQPEVPVNLAVPLKFMELD